MTTRTKIRTITILHSFMMNTFHSNRFGKTVQVYSIQAGTIGTWYIFDLGNLETTKNEPL